MRNIIRANDVQLTTSSFYGRSNLKTVNLRNVPFQYNSAAYCFEHCPNLTSVYNINQNVTNMYYTFYGCSNLITAPEIPSNVTSIYKTFGWCNSLVNAPSIPNTVTNMSSTFSYCSNLVNMSEIPNSVTDMFQTFLDCYNLVNVPAIPNSVTDMKMTFYGCSNLINSPIIPNSVTSLTETFMECTNLVNAPVIPNNITSMGGTFSTCSNLVNAPSIPNSVGSMYYAFAYCTNLVNIPEIPCSVNYIDGMFSDCNNLTGNIFIKSNQIYSAYNCFDNTSLQKNVYIPFTYENGVNTLTYNSFISAGYDNTGTSCGVYLKDLSNPCEVTINVNQFGTDNIIYVDNTKLSGNIVNCIYGSHNITVATKEEGLYEGTFNITFDEMGSSKTITINMTSSGSRLKISGTIDDITVETDTTMSYEDSFGNLIKFKTSSLAVKENTNVTYKAEYVYNGDAYIANGTQVVSGVVNLVLPLTLVQDENVDLVYPFDQNYLTITKSLTQYEVSSTLQALVSGPSSYHVDNGTSYGSIKFKTGTDNLTLTVTGYVSSESNYDFGAVYIGTSEYKPTWSQLRNGTTDGNGNYILRSSGIGTSTTYTYTLQPNTEYYLSLAYAKDSSSYSGEDRLIIQEIKFTSVATKKYKIDVENYDIQYIDDTNIILTSYTGGGTDVKVPEPVWR